MRHRVAERDVKRILIAEDEQPVARIVQVNLGREGYEVDWVPDGVAALAAVAENPPDLVILDVTMPQMDGFEVLRRLKSDPETSELPVIMLTGKSDDESVFKGWAEGVHSYMTKPFDPRDLTLMVERVLSDSENWDAEV